MSDFEPRPIKGHFTCLGSAKKSKPKWIIDGVATTGLTFIIGPPKDSFKTTIEMAFALLIARQEHHVLPREWTAKIKGPCLIFEGEADVGELKEMCEDGMGLKVPADESIMVCDAPEEYRLDDEFAVEQMISWCEERNVAACMLGPLTNFHEIDEKDATQMVKILQPLRKWAKKNDTGFFITHHTRKIEDGKVYTSNDARGTSAIFGLCDNIITITPGKEPYELLIQRKGKKGQAWEKTFFLNVWDRRGKSNREAFRQVDKMILKAILQGFKTQVEIVEHIGLAPKQVVDRLSVLIKQEVIALHGTVLKLKEKLTLQDLS